MLWSRLWKYLAPRLMPEPNLPMKPPVVVVLGATGAGKSQLAIEIASKFNGEIISADAMQMYKKLDVTTNKVTDEEMCGVKHHLIDFVDPLESFTIVDFRNRALPIIDKLLEANKMPVIVGGTNYYIESLMFDTLVRPDDHKDTELVSKIPFGVDANESTSVLHDRLKRIDPERAEQIHPNDRRKIERSLDIYNTKKRSHTEFLEEQKKSNGSSFGGPLRFKNSVMFHIQCQQDVLDERLDKRVDKMIERGLIEEMLDFHRSYNATRQDPDYTIGIFQSIGFKEFHDYLIGSPEFRESKKGKKLFERSLLLMKQRTKRYSRYQEKWVRKRFLAVEREVPTIFGLMGTDVAKWNENVRDVAYEIMDDFLAGKTDGRHKPLEKVTSERKRNKQFVCECGTISMNDISHQKHLTSKKHYRNIKALRKEQESVRGGDAKRLKASEDSSAEDQSSVPGEEPVAKEKIATN